MKNYLSALAEILSAANSYQDQWAIDHIVKLLELSTTPQAALRYWRYKAKPDVKHYLAVRKLSDIEDYLNGRMMQ